MQMTNEEQEWHAWRNGDDLPPDQQPTIGASDIAKAASGKYGGLLDVVGVKRGLLTADEINPELAKRGHEWEERLADIAATGSSLYVVGEQTWCEHPDMPWARATVDGFLAPVDPATLEQVTDLLEIKTRSTEARGGLPWDYYEAQVQWQMWVTGVGSALVQVGFISDVDGRLTGTTNRFVDADEHYQQWLVTMAEDIRHHVQNDTLPVRKDAELETVKGLQRIESDDVLEVEDTDVEGQNLSDWFAQFAEAKADESAAKGRKRSAESVIRQTMNEHKRMTVDGWSAGLAIRNVMMADGESQLLALHPEFGKTVLDRDKAKEADNELYEAMRTPTYVLTVKPPKNEENR